MAPPLDASISWDPVLHFSSYRPSKDGTAVALPMGKFLVLGGLQEDMTTISKAQLLEWNLRRTFPWPDLEQARFGACSANFQDESVWIIGGANDSGKVLTTVEGFPLSPSANPTCNWQTSSCELPNPRIYAAAVAVPTLQGILVVGGRNSSWQELDTMELGVMEDNTIVSWENLPMPGPRMGAAAMLFKDTCLLLMGGYDGRSWRRTCQLYEFPPNQISKGTWRDLPEMLETIRFVKAVRYYKYILVVGERDESPLSKSKPTTSIQCYDTQAKKWLWAKQCVCPSFDIVTIHGTQLYGFTTSSHNTQPTVYTCELSQLDPQIMSSATPVAFGIEAPDDSEAPTIFAADAVLVAEDTTSTNNNLAKAGGMLSAQPYTRSTSEEPIQLRNVVKIKLDEKSYYTGQLRKKDGSYVPHGQGLLVWIDNDKEGSPDSSTQSGQPNSSYYKGQFVNGFRHGLGEMYLQVEDKHYVGAFESGSWQGIGSFKIRSRGFSYFGQFVAGEMTGHGRCSYRVRQGDQSWKQKMYSGDFQNGLAHGRGVVTDYLSGRIEVDREFHQEDLVGWSASARIPLVESAASSQSDYSTMASL
jgi:hypothetical protein